MELSAWLLGPALEEGILSARRLHWPSQWGVPLHDAEVTVRLGNTSTIGRALALDFDTAFLIAGAEALERHFTLAAGVSDAGGFAVHTSRTEAARNAAWEREERESFLSHFVTKTPPLARLSLGDIPAGPFRDLAEKLAHVGVDWVFTRLSSAPGAEVVLCAAFGKRLPQPFGVVLGLGVGISISDALMRSVRECVCNVVGLVSGELYLKPLVCDATHVATPLSGEERFRWGLSFECARFVHEWLQAEGPAQTFLAADTDAEEITLELFEAKDLWPKDNAISPLLSPPPLVFARASVPSGLTMTKVNGRRDASLVPRLEHLLGKKISAGDLTPFPPPLG